jgi:hypothetical protein
MQPRFLLGLVTGAFFLLAGCDFDDGGLFGSAQSYKEDFRHSYPLKPGGRLSLEGFNGSVEIAGWSENTVEITGAKYGATPQLRDSMKIDIAASADAVRIRAIRPHDRRGNLGARFVIKVPKKIELDSITSSNGHIEVVDIDGAVKLRTSNGRVTASNIQGAVDVQTSNGSVELRDLGGPATVKTSNGPVRASGVLGSFEASTSNGAIRASLQKAEPGRAIRVSTSNGPIELSLDSFNRNDVYASSSNGGITLRLPVTASARVRARTSNSSISSEFDLKREGENSKTRLEGVIGGGGPLLDLITSNGGIRLQKM